MKRYYRRLFTCLIISNSLLCICLNSYAQKITVMTYNIYHGEQNYERGKSNLKQIAEVIKQFKPDFVALQEVDSMTNRSAVFNHNVPQDLVQELAKLTGMYGFFGKAIDYSNGKYGEGILSRFPAQSRVYDLPIPQGGEGRALLTVEHTLPNGRKVIFAGTHLCHQFPENRLVQAEAIHEIFKDTQLPVIIGGDFNFRPDTDPYKVITRQFKDAAVVKGDPQPTISFENPRGRIDYIFISGQHPWTILDVKVIRNNASDHMPVLVTLELNNN